MRRAIAPLVLVLALLPLAGCLQVHTLLRLNADGSGTIEETVALNSSLLQMLRAAALEEGAEVDASLIDEARLRARAAELGEGVTFLRAEPLDLLFGGGFVAVYAFEDVNRLRLTQDFESALPAALSELAEDEIGDVVEEDEAADEPVTFAYTPGALTIRIPQPEHDEAEEEPADEEGASAEADSTMQAMQQQMMAGMMGMFQDMGFSLAVELPGPITDTDAAFATDRTVTLVEVDMGPLMQDPEMMQLLDDAGGPGNFQRLAALGEVPGLRVESAPEVTVRFEE